MQQNINRINLQSQNIRAFSNHLLSLLLLLLPLLSLAESNNKSQQATVIHFSEYEQGIGQYPVTMTITDDFLRIDDTQEGKDFVLLNRKEKIIYSVNSEDQHIIQIKLMPVTIPSPMVLNIREEQLEMDAKAPLIAGKKARRHHFYVNDKLCYELIAVPELMPDSVSALKEFKQILAGQQSETLRSIPGDLQNGCDLVRHTFYPQLYLEKGFPIMEKAIDPSTGKGDKTDNIHYSRALVNFMEKEIAPERFILPEYQLIPIN